MIKYVVFDFDGTIADSYEIVLNKVKNMKKISEKKVNFDDIKEKGIEKMIKNSGVPRWKIPFYTRKFLKLLRYDDDVRIYPGLKISLNSLKKDFKLGLVTSNSKKNVESFLDKNGVSKIFDFIYPDSSLFGKNKVLKKLLKKQKIKEKEVIYVGDEDRDIKAARKVNMKVIAVTWGFNSSSRLNSESPDAIAYKPSQLVGGIKRLSGK